MFLFISNTWENLISDFGAEMERLKSEGVKFETYPQSEREKNNYKIFSLKPTQVKYKDLSRFDDIESSYFYRLMRLLRSGRLNLDMPKELVAYENQRWEKDETKEIEVGTSLYVKFIEESARNIFNRVIEMQKADANSEMILSMLEKEIGDIVDTFT
jgi:hypothetical protein